VSDVLDEVTTAEQDSRAPTRPIGCVHATPGEVTWFNEQLDGLAVMPWETSGGSGVDPSDPGSVDRWVADAVGAIRDRGNEPVHVLATGPTAHPAIVLAARHPQLVTSLILGDPEVDHHRAGYAELLRSVCAPTLVIAAAPEATHDAGPAQRIAGGIDNGVFVIIDGCPIPAYRERSSSFNEWVVSFTIIAEGLRALATHRQEEVRG